MRLHAGPVERMLSDTTAKRLNKQQSFPIGFLSTAFALHNQ